MLNGKHYAKQREAFLKAEFPKLHKKMTADGTLDDHLKMIAEESEDLASTLYSQMMEAAPEEMDKRMQHFEGIPLAIREIVQHDLILVPPSR